MEWRRPYTDSSWRQNYNEEFYGKLVIDRGRGLPAVHGSIRTLQGIYPACGIYGGISGGSGNCARIHAESNRIFKRKYVDTADAVQQHEAGSGLPEETGDEEEKDEDVPSVQRTIIENLNLPQNVKSALIENNNHEVYELLGVNAFADYIGNYLADMILNSVGFVLMFAIVYLLIKLVVRWLDLIARLPILSGMNKIAGALLGGVQGLIFLWILCLVLTACSGTSWGMTLIRQVEASKWLSFLYEHNFLNAIVLSVIHGML